MASKSASTSAAAHIGSSSTPDGGAVCNEGGTAPLVAGARPRNYGAAMPAPDVAAGHNEASDDQGVKAARNSATGSPGQPDSKATGPIAAVRRGARSVMLFMRPVVLLENRASVARDHLANERTFLAWLRSSLNMTSVGVGT